MEQLCMHKYIYGLVYTQWNLVRVQVEKLKDLCENFHHVFFSKTRHEH